jgi:hypothetical protein
MREAGMLAFLFPNEEPVSPSEAKEILRGVTTRDCSLRAVFFVCKTRDRSVTLKVENCHAEIQNQKVTFGTKFQTSSLAQIYENNILFVYRVGK